MVAAPTSSAQHIGLLLVALALLISAGPASARHGKRMLTQADAYGDSYPYTPYEYGDYGPYTPDEADSDSEDEPAGPGCAATAMDMDCLNLSLPPTLPELDMLDASSLLPTVAGFSVLDFFDLNYAAAAWKYLGEAAQDSCEAIPIYYGETIREWEDEPPAALELLDMGGTCGSLPVNDTKTYIIGVLPFNFLRSMSKGFGPDQSFQPSGGVKGNAATAVSSSGGEGEGEGSGSILDNLAVCLALNPCTDDVLFGFSGLEANVPLPFPGLEFTVGLSSLSVSRDGQLSYQSDMEVWTLAGGDSKAGTLEQLEVAAHLVLTGSAEMGFSLPPGATESVASVSMAGSVTLAINWDTLADGNGDGNNDHMVMLHTTAAPKVTFLDTLEIDLSGMGEFNYMLYWNYESDSAMQVLLALERQMSIHEMISSIPGIGDDLEKLFIIDLEMSVAAGFYADVDNWGLRFSLDASISITEEAATNLQTDAGSEVDTELILKGNRKGDVSVIFALNGNLFEIQFCDSSDDCVEEGYACFAFICRPRNERLGFCTVDDHCKSGHCLDEKALLQCGDCSQDEHCPEGYFCETNAATTAGDARDLLGTCRAKLVGGQPCDRDPNCQSGQCVGIFGADTGVLGKCLGCTSDAECGEGSYCSDVLTTDSQMCRPKLDGGAACQARKQCKSDNCNGFCRDCLEDGHCPDDQFCELNPFHSALWTCRGTLESGSSCDRDRACASGTCSGLPLFKSCD